MLNVLLVAEEAAGLQALKLLAESDHRVTAVLSSTGEERGAGVARAAAGLGLPIADPRAVTEPAFADRFRDQGVDLLVNVHSLHIAAAEVVAAPRIGSFNLHPGPLPEYAGLNAPSWAIFEGRSQHAVTLHWMEADVDAGPIAYSTTFPIEPEDTGASLMAKCVRHGVPLVGRLLEDAEEGRIPRREQNACGRRWHGRDAPHGGRLPWALPRSCATRSPTAGRSSHASRGSGGWATICEGSGDAQLSKRRRSGPGRCAAAAPPSAAARPMPRPTATVSTPGSSVAKRSL